MRWKSDWWGITLVAESEDDNDFLLNLKTKLPESPLELETYEDGNIQVDVDKNNAVSLVFNR
jgi:hypothetical protein